MKTFLEKLFLRIDFITHPSGGWLPQKAESSKQKPAPKSIKHSISPDCYNMRSASKKQQQLRQTPAP